MPLWLTFYIIEKSHKEFIKGQAKLLTNTGTSCNVKKKKKVKLNQPNFPFKESQAA